MRIVCCLMGRFPVRSVPPLLQLFFLGGIFLVTWICYNATTRVARHPTRGSFDEPTVMLVKLPGPLKSTHKLQQTIFLPCSLHTHNLFPPTEDRTSEIPLAHPLVMQRDKSRAYPHTHMAPTRPPSLECGVPVDWHVFFVAAFVCHLLRPGTVVWEN